MLAHRMNVSDPRMVGQQEPDRAWFDHTRDDGRTISGGIQLIQSRMPKERTEICRT
jgi:hypothetical protein